MPAHRGASPAPSPGSETGPSAAPEAKCLLPKVTADLDPRVRSPALKPSGGPPGPGSLASLCPVTPRSQASPPAVRVLLRAGAPPPNTVGWVSPSRLRRCQQRHTEHCSGYAGAGAQTRRTDRVKPRDGLCRAGSTHDHNPSMRPQRPGCEVLTAVRGAHWPCPSGLSRPAPCPSWAPLCPAEGCLEAGVPGCQHSRPPQAPLPPPLHPSPPHRLQSQGTLKAKAHTAECRNPPSCLQRGPNCTCDAPLFAISAQQTGWLPPFKGRLSPGITGCRWNLGEAAARAGPTEARRRLQKQQGFHLLQAVGKASPSAHP